jgi:hypothetical protein
MTFDFALWSEGQVPVTLVCEEAHRYVPVNSSLGFEPCKRAIAKIAKEGRKYGASLCIVTQRPAEIDPTILSQCNTVFALRMANDKDQAIVQSAVADTGSGLLEFLPSLGQREAIAFGDGMSLPVRIKFDELPKHCLPRSSTARFSEKWQKSMGDEGFLEQVVDRWRMSGIGSGGDISSQVAMMADAVGISAAQDHDADFDTPQSHGAPYGQPGPYGEPAGRPSQLQPQAAPQGFGQASAYGRSAQSMRKESGMGQIAQSAGGGGYAGRNAPAASGRGAPGQPPADMPAPGGNNNSLRSLRDRLMRHQN